VSSSTSPIFCIARVGLGAVNLVTAPANYLLTSSSPSAAAFRADLLSKGTSFLTTVGTELYNIGYAFWNMAAGLFTVIRRDNLQGKDKRLQQEEELRRQKQKEQGETANNFVEPLSNSIIKPSDGSYQPMMLRFLFSSQQQREEERQQQQQQQQQQQKEGQNPAEPAAPPSK